MGTMINDRLLLAQTSVVTRCTLLSFLEPENRDHHGNGSITQFTRFDTAAPNDYHRAIIGETARGITERTKCEIMAADDHSSAINIF